MVALSDNQRSILHSLKKHSPAFADGSTEFAMRYAPPLRSDPRRIAALVGAAIGTTWYARTLFRLLTEGGETVNWIGFALYLPFVVLGWIMAMSKHQLTWTNGMPHVHRAGKTTDEEPFGVPTEIRFDETEGERVVYVDGVRCKAALPEDVPVLRALLAGNRLVATA